LTPFDGCVESIPQDSKGRRHMRCGMSEIGWIVGLSLLAVGCDRSGSTSVGDAASLKEVRLGYFANVTHAQAVLGVSTGEFAQAVAPATLKTQVFNAGPSLIEALFAGQLDIGYVGPSPALTGFAQSGGTKVRIVAGAAANGILIVARKDSGIVKLEDLRGRKVATPQKNNTQDIAARHYVLSVLKQDSDENIKAIANADQAALMARGEIDAAWVPEPWGSRLMAETGAVLVGKEEDLWPDKMVNLTVVVTTPEFLAAHPDVVEKVLRVHCQWTQRLSADPTKYARPLNDALADLVNKRLADGVVESSLTNVKFTDEPLEQTLNTMSQWAYDLGVFPQLPALKGMVDLRVLEKVKGGR
jgi:NitT/TauT family transport system substrate-binding protein